MRGFIVLIFCFLGLAAGAQNCKISEKVQGAQNFVVDIERSTFPKDTTLYTFVSFKHPATSDEVLNSDLIDCDGWMPEGALIKNIQIQSLSGLPKGSKWFCAQPNCSWAGGEKGCIKIKVQTPNTAQSYTITIKTEGKGSLYGINKTYTCYLKFKVRVQ